MACKSPTILSEVYASNRATLRVRNVLETDSKGSKGASDKISRTTGSIHAQRENVGVRRPGQHKKLSKLRP